MKPKYLFRFFYDWGSTPLWSANDAAYEKFGFGDIILEEFLSPETVKRADELSDWYYTSLNQDYPPDPSLWRQEECDRFNAAVKQLFETMKAELGEEFELQWEQEVLVEHPDLDEYLKDPNAYDRKRWGMNHLK